MNNEYKKKIIEEYNLTEDELSEFENQHSSLDIKFYIQKHDIEGDNFMGKNKGKGASNLRRNNMVKKIERNMDKEFNKIMTWKEVNKIPACSFGMVCSYSTLNRNR